MNNRILTDEKYDADNIEPCTWTAQKPQSTKETPEKKVWPENVQKLIDYYEEEIISYLVKDCSFISDKEKRDRLEQTSKCLSFFGFNSIDEKELISKIRKALIAEGRIKPNTREKKNN